MKDFSMYKYFKGELKNPFSENDLLASKWWNGERLFYENAQSNPHFIDIIRKQLKEQYSNVRLLYSASCELLSLVRIFDIRNNLC